MANISVRAPAWTSRPRAWLPTGGLLPADAWDLRHRWILKLLWAHAVALIVASLTVGNGVVHSLIEGGIIAAFA